MSIEGIRVKYADILTLLIIFKGTVNMSSDSSGKYEMRVVLLDFSLEIRVEHTTSFLVFHAPWEMSKKKIKVKYADFLTLQSTFKGSVDIN